MKQTCVFSFCGCQALQCLRQKLMPACRDGRMDPAGPTPCAAVQGTTLVVEDLFYNMLTRKKVPPLLAFLMSLRVVGTKLGERTFAQHSWTKAGQALLA